MNFLLWGSREVDEGKEYGVFVQFNFTSFHERMCRGPEQAGQGLFLSYQCGCFCVDVFVFVCVNMLMVLLDCDVVMYLIFY